MKCILFVFLLILPFQLSARCTTSRTCDYMGNCTNTETCDNSIDVFTPLGGQPDIDNSGARVLIEQSRRSGVVTPKCVLEKGYDGRYREVCY